tara:strand:+ start:166 stop:351 length:186 start_codon:yes stop_codon:yes gene_type:complete
MIKFFKKFIQEITILGWTIGGTALVLITLSGETREYGIWISIASFIVHMFGVLINWNDEEE